LHGSVPLLRLLCLGGIQFPRLPNLFCLGLTSLLLTFWVANTFQLDTPVSWYQLTGCTASQTDMNRKKVSHTSRQIIRWSQVLHSFTVYLRRMGHSNFSGCLKNPIDVELQEAAAMSENLDLHNDSAMIRYRGLDRDFVSVLVFCFSHVEYRER